MTDEDPTTTDVIAEMAKQHPLYGAADRPDLRRLAKLTEQVSIDATCENTGATPLLWAIENDSPLFSFLLVRQPDVTKRGKGEYDITPIDLAMSKGLIEKAETLARWGAPCPPAIQEQWDAEKRGREKYDQEIKKTERMLEKGLKAASFTEETKRLEAMTWRIREETTRPSGSFIVQRCSCAEARKRRSNQRGPMACNAS